MKINFVIALVSILAFTACKKGKEFTTDSGFKYRLYTENTGRKPILGDYVILELVYSTSKDSILFDSRKSNTPLRFRFEKIPFAGSYEDGLTYMSVGDSATFFVPADSLYAFYYGNVENNIDQSATIFSSGTYFHFNVKLIAVQDYVEAEQDQMMKLSEQEKAEKVALIKFLRNKGFSNSSDSGIYFFKSIKDGKGTQVGNGKFVTIQYTGKFLDGKVFDYSGDPQKPFTFRVGSQSVVIGLDLAVSLLRVGDRVELVLPSKSAYAEIGLLDSKESKFLIPPHTPIFYELEVLNVQDTLRLLKKN